MRSLLLFIAYGLSTAAFIVIMIVVCMAAAAFPRRLF
jgi:hypothetical protein